MPDLYDFDSGESLGGGLYDFDTGQPLQADQMSLRPYGQAPNAGGDPGRTNRGLGRRIDTLGRGFATGALWGGANELAASVSALPSVLRGGDAYGQDFQRVLREQDTRDAADMRDMPITRTAGIIGGALANARAVPGINAGTTLGRVGAGALQGALYGGLQGSLGTDGSIPERIEGGARGALTGGALGGVLGGVLGRGKSALSGYGAERELLKAEGVPLTAGQRAGGALKDIENKATSLPLTGMAIRGAQRESIEGFNRAAINRALQPLGVTLPKKVPAGREAIAFMQAEFNKAYDDALSQMALTRVPGLDRRAETIAKQAEGVATSQIAEQLRGIYKNVVQPRWDQLGQMTGEQYKAVQSELSRLERTYSGSAIGSERELARFIGQLGDDLATLAQAQNPNIAPRLQDIDRGYAMLARVEDAAAKTGAQSGVFTPAQLRAAVRSGDSSVRRRAFARGDALLQDLAEAGQSVLPNNVPDSGTAGRVAISGAMVGAGALNPMFVKAALADAAGAAAYSPPGRAVLGATAKAGGALGSSSTGRYLSGRVGATATEERRGAVELYRYDDATGQWVDEYGRVAPPDGF